MKVEKCCQKHVTDSKLLAESAENVTVESFSRKESNELTINLIVRVEMMRNILDVLELYVNLPSIASHQLRNSKRRDQSIYSTDIHDRTTNTAQKMDHNYG